jgi:alkylation response protein AidB-like acyl-CoA dehydrogenase
VFTPEKNELKAFSDLARTFAAKELAGKVGEHDRYPFAEFFHSVLDKAYTVGFLTVMLPDAPGGTSRGITALCEILQKICEVNASLAGIIFTNALSQEILLAADAQDLALTIFSKATSAKEVLVSFPAYTNPAQTDALPGVEGTGGNYALTGRLEFLVLGNIAEQAIIPARAGKGPEYSFFLIHLADETVEKSDPILTLGLHACPTLDVTLQRVKAKLVGGENMGNRYFEKALLRMNVAAAAMNAGIIRGSFDEALAYSRKRLQGGRPIANWSEVGMMLAGMFIKADAAAMCVAQSCLELEQTGDPCASRVLAASLHVHELACEATGDGIQILGGYGYMKDNGQEKRFRDARMVQALLGPAPMRKLDMIRHAARLDKSDTKEAL